MDLFLWISGSLLLLSGFKQCINETTEIARPILSNRTDTDLRSVGGRIHLIQETIEAGLIPEETQWQALAKLPAPWGALVGDCIAQLRSSGHPILPTLRRIRELAEESRSVLSSAKGKAAQALAQCLVCSALVPVLTLALYAVLPGLEARLWEWVAVGFISCTLSLIGAFWVHRLAENARWGGLSLARRGWMIAAPCAAERVVALVRSGVPADMAWVQAHEFLQQEAPGLSQLWRASVWDPAQVRSETDSTLLECIRMAGESLRRAIQIGVMEGKPCVERLEAALAALRIDMRGRVDRELSLLPTRALLPLFTCVAPALLGQLAAGLALSWMSL